MTDEERRELARRLNNEASRRRYARLRADPAAHKAYIKKQVERQRLRRSLVFESDYIVAGLGHLLEGAVEA